MTPPLSTPAIVQAMADALPTHKPDDDTSDLASSYELIALLVHAYLASLSFRLCGFTQDKPSRELSYLPLTASPTILSPISGRPPPARFLRLILDSRVRESCTKTPYGMELGLRLSQLRVQAQAVVYAVYHARGPHGKQSRSEGFGRRR